MLLALALVTTIACAEGNAPNALDVKRARALNDEGLALHKQGKLVEGAALFREALELDPNYAIAHYNLACALARLRTAKMVCDGDAYHSSIMEHLRKSIALDAKRLDRARVDDDLKGAHDSLAWHRDIMKRDLKSDDDIRIVLVAVTWFQQRTDAYKPVNGIRFAKDGTVTFRRPIDSVNDAAAGKETLAGTWSVKGGRVEIVVTDGVDGKKKTLKGALSWAGVSIEWLGAFDDDPDECNV